MKIEDIAEDRFKDIVARIALAIQRAGPDYLGSVDTIHADFLTIVITLREVTEKLQYKDTRLENIDRFLQNLATAAARERIRQLEEMLRERQSG